MKLALMTKNMTTGSSVMNVTRIGCVLLFCLFSGAVHAFKPFYVTDGNTHEGIIQVVWDNIHEKKEADFDFVDSDNYYFMPNAMVELENETGNADFYFPFHPAEAHCDNETIEGCSRWIYKKTECAVDFMGNGHWTKGYHALGTALHALQDFYSHSNWIKLSKDKGGTIENEKITHMLRGFGQQIWS